MNSKLLRNPSSFFHKIFMLHKGEGKLLFYSALFVFSLFVSYSVLRPVRDALALYGGTTEIKWLFLGTFILSLFASFLIMFISGRIARKKFINGIYLFFIFNLFIYYGAFNLISAENDYYIYLSRIFYIWVSVFNLTIVSLSWSMLADIFTKEISRRHFGIIAAGASVGSIFGAFVTGLLSNFFSVASFILFSAVFLVFALLLKNLLLKEAVCLADSGMLKNTANFNLPIGSDKSFVGIFRIFCSKYFIMFLLFIFLLTSVSTFLYMEQARVIKLSFISEAERIKAFAYIDFIVQSLSFIIQIFFASRVVSFFGLKFMLSFLGVLLSIGFIVLIFTHPSFIVFVTVMCLRRVGEYALIKPAREMLFVVLDDNVKYKVKNFLDTVVYRAGDALSAQVEGALAGIGVSAVLFAGAVISLLWSLCGLYLGIKYDDTDKA